MPGKGKKMPRAAVKMPEGVVPLTRSNSSAKKDMSDVEKQVDEFTDNLMQSEWQSHIARPRGDTVGYYVVCRWFAKYKNWAILYIGKGAICKKLDAHFSGKDHSPFSFYLSSFPKSSRNLLWFKWIKDPFYPYEGFNMGDILESIKNKYNDGEMPAFNSDVGDGVVPDNSSILGSSWKKTKKKLK